jgi:hypothetical protein
MSMVAIRILASALCLAASSITAFADDPLPRAKPEEVGLSSERLARIGETLKADIEMGRIPGGDRDCAARQAGGAGRLWLAR